MASDITLAVGNGARRMTYAELAAVREISPASAKRLTQRHHWGRQVGNDGVVRVTVPLSALAKPAQTKVKRVAPDTDPVTGLDVAATPDYVADDVFDDVAGDVAPIVALATEPLARAVEVLRDQLDVANSRANRAERRVDELQALLTEGRRQLEDSHKRIDELHTGLADAVTAERIAAGEAAALRAIVTGLRARRWWRRWFR